MGKITFFRENLLSLQFFLRGTMVHSTLRMIAVVKQSVSFYQPFFSDANSWGWSLLLLTISHTLIQWLQLQFVEFGLQRMLSWPFIFIWPAAFVSNLLLAKWICADYCSHPDVPSADFSLRFYHLCSSPHASSLSISVSSCLIISDVPWTFFGLPRYLLTWP